MASVSLLDWLQEVYIYNIDFLFSVDPSSARAWDNLLSGNGSGANYTSDGGAVSPTNSSSRPVLEPEQSTTSAANVGLATGVLLAVLLNSHYEAIRKEWTSEYQVWAEAVIIRVVFSTACLLLALATAPVALVAFTIFACYRNVVHILLKLLHGRKFAGLMDGVDTVWALEEDAAKSVVNVLGMLEVDDAPDDDVLLDTLRKTIVSRFITPANHCQKLLYLRRRSVLGYFYWEWRSGLHIDSHVRWMPEDPRLEDDGGLSEEMLSEIVSKLVNEQLPADHSSSWEVLVSRRPMSKLSGDPFQSMEEGFPVRSSQYRKYPVLFRVHHAVGDGVALLQLMMKALAEDWPVNRKTACGQRDGNLPDICNNTGENSFTQQVHSKIPQYLSNTANEYNDVTPKEMVKKDKTYKIHHSKLYLEGTNSVISVAKHTKNTPVAHEGNIKLKNKISKPCSIKPFEFQSDKIYNNTNAKIPCYATHKEFVKHSVPKSISINRNYPNMVVYFHKSLPVTDYDVHDYMESVNQCRNKSTNVNACHVRNSHCKTAENYCTKIGIDETELDSETDSPVFYQNENSNIVKLQLSEESNDSEFSDGVITNFSSPTHCYNSSTKQTSNSPDSHILSYNFCSHNTLVSKHKDNIMINNKNDSFDSMYWNDDYRSFSPQVESRQGSPPSRPLTPTPYSLFQNTTTMSPNDNMLSTNRSMSPLQDVCDNSPFSLTSTYLTSETRPASPYSSFQALKERSVSPPCLSSVLDKPTPSNMSPVPSKERFVHAEISASPQNIYSNNSKRLYSSNKMKCAGINDCPKNKNKKTLHENLKFPTPWLKMQNEVPKNTKFNTSANSKFTVVPLSSSEKSTSHNSHVFQTNGRYNLVNYLKNILNIRTKVKMLVKSNECVKLNCYVQLLSTISGKNSKRFKAIYGLWHILSALIYAPASLIHQMLMKTSDKNSLHGPTLSGKKVIAFYSDTSMPSICKEYRLLNTIKRIKSRVKCQARFTDIFLTAVSSSLEMYFLGKGADVPSSVNVVIPLRMEPMPEGFSKTVEISRTTVETKTSFKSSIIADGVQNKSNNLINHTKNFAHTSTAFVDLPVDIEAPQPSNQFSVALLTLPITPPTMQTCDEPLKSYSLASRIQEVCIQSELLRNSLDYRVNYWLMRVVATLLPIPLLRTILNSTQSTLVVSNMRGPSEDVYLAGYKLGDLAFWVPNRGTTGIGISLMSYADRLQVGLIADTAVVPTRHDAQTILHSVVSELRQMDAALSI